jgi:cell division protein FtsQ
MGHRKVRKNRVRRKRAAVSLLSRITAALQALSTVCAVAVVSLLLVFVHDLVTQCDVFRAKTVVVEGHRRLSLEDIYRLAEIGPGDNILAVNLAAARKRLLSDPWIAEAHLRREVPDGIRIQVREHRAAAVIDLGRKYLVDDRGIIFKDLEADEDNGLPVIEGLRYADIRIEAPARGIRFLTAAAGAEEAAAEGALYDAAVSAIQLGDPQNETGRILRIQADREAGLILATSGEPRIIKLGFGDYPGKIAALAQLLPRLRHLNTAAWPGIQSIDLNDLNRIVVQPLDASVAAAGDQSPTG